MRVDGLEDAATSVDRSIAISLKRIADAMTGDLSDADTGVVNAIIDLESKVYCGRAVIRALYTKGFRIIRK